MVYRLGGRVRYYLCWLVGVGGGRSGFGFGYWVSKFCYELEHRV